MSIAEFALAAAEYVRRAVSLELDGSPESLAYADHYAARAAPVTDESLALSAPALGAYFGEVVLARLRGAWEHEDAEPAAWRIALHAEGGETLARFSPVAMAACALRGGEVEGWDDSVDTPPEYTAALEEALAAIEPVDARYYYSLTGRLETLEHMVDLLNAIRARASG